VCDDGIRPPGRAKIEVMPGFLARARTAGWRHFPALRRLGASGLAILLGVIGAEVHAQGDPELPAGEGRDALVQACSRCHAIGLVTSKPRTSEEWTTTIGRMISLGAVLAPEQVETIHRYLSRHFGTAQIAAAVAPPVSAAGGARTPRQQWPRPFGPNQWPAYGGGPANQNYSPLTQITPRNVSRLRPAWTYRYGAGSHDSGDQGLDYRFEVTPLVIGGVMYISTPGSPRAPGLKSTITALRPETGEVIWKFESPLNIHGRGLAYWPGDSETAPRLIFGTDGGYVMAVDVTTGQLAPDFGNGGWIDAYVGVASEIVGDTRRRTYTIPNPVAIYGNLFITGARPGEAGPPGPRGDIRAWDVRTGRLVWTFHTVPQPGEPNHETYKDDEWRDLSGANVWSTMAVDEENGIVFAPTGDLNGRAQGPELYSNSLLALDAKTGRLLWYRQITHKDLWDWDLPTPPVLLDLERDGRTIPAVLQTGKHGLVFLFNRLTGEPINGFEERPVPGTNIPGVTPWPTQPFPARPGPIARTSMTRDEIPDLVPGMKEYCTKFWDDNDILSAGLYSLPQADRATLIYPGPTGGPNWGGGSYNPLLGYYFINVQNLPRFRPPSPSGDPMINRSAWRPSAASAPATGQPRRRDGGFGFQLDENTVLPCAALPWGELVAIDVRKEKIAWRVPLGMTEALGARGLATGAPNLGGSMTTASGLVFIGATRDRRFRAFDARTGRKLWEAELEAGAHATPITYMGSDGKQYVVIAAGGGTTAGGPRISDTLVAFSLP